MKKLLFLILLLIVIAGALVATCPDKEAHREAVKGVMAGVINSEMDQSKIEETMASIGTMLAVSAVDAYLKSNLVIRDHTFYNIGVISYRGEFRMVSVGVLNHVFTISEDDARKMIKENLPKL